MPNRPFSPDTLEQAISNIVSRSGVIRVARALRRKGIDLTDASRADAALTRFLEMSFEVESREDEMGDGGDSLDHYRKPIYTHRAIARYYMAAYSSGLADAYAFLAISRSEGNLFEQAAAWNSISGHLDALGRTRQSREAAAEAVSAYRRIENIPADLANALYTLALCEYRSGMKVAALDHLAEAVDLLTGMNEEDEPYRQRRLLASYILRLKILRGLGRSIDAAADVARVIAMVDSAEPNVRQWGYIELAQFYYDIEAHTEAMDYALRSLAVVRQIRNSATEAELLCTIGDIHKLLGESDEALTLYRDAFQIARDCEHRHVQAGASVRLVGMLIVQGKLDEAREEVDRCLKIVGKKDLQVEALIELGRIHRLDGRPAEAMNVFREAIESSRKAIDIRPFSRALYESAVVQYEQEEHSDAIATLREILALDDSHAAVREVEQRVDGEVVVNAHAMLVTIYRERGEYDLALHHSERHRELAVRRARDLADRHLANYRALYEVDRLRDKQTRERLARERVEHSLATLSTELLDRQQLIKRLERELQLLVKDSSEGHGESAAVGLRSTLRSLRDGPPASRDLHTYLRSGGGTFLDDLRRRHSNLTEGQYRLCGMLWSGRDTSEIASILHITLDAVRMNRKRLRKALGLPKEKKLEAYLQEISSGTPGDS